MIVAGILIRIAIISMVWAIALAPLELFFLARYLLEPSGFWQNLILYGMGIYILGGMQIILFLLGIVATIVIVGTDFY